MGAMKSIMTQEEYENEVILYRNDPIIFSFNRAICKVMEIAPVSGILNSDGLNLQIPNLHQNRIKEIEKERDVYIKNTYGHILK